MSETQQDSGRRRLPIGIQDFRRIRERNFYYVDKTPLIKELIDQGDYYFLSRPRRFGKSLLLDTIGELFAGREELFRDLAIYDQWDWTNRYPVVRLSFDGKYNEPGEVEADIHGQLEGIEETEGIDSPANADSTPVRLRRLLRRLHQVTGQQAVILVDEYDKPILDVLEAPELAKANRDYLRGFYGIIKGSAEHVRFVFVTGVSMFSKVSLFSGLNNLEDISLVPRFATICGYTDDDIDRVFAPELKGLNREEMRHWYNGYNWRSKEKLYNPFDALLLFRNREFRSWWFETGSPNFLFRLLMEQEVSPIELENRIADEKLVSKFDVGDISVDALLFQTGYLTIAEEQMEGHKKFYVLDYPNFEVQQSLNDGLLGYLGKTGSEVSNCGRELSRFLEANDFDGFTDSLRSFLAGIPYQWQTGGNPARYEAWYAGMLYACFRTIGLDLRLEDASSRGRADMVVLHGGQVYVFEFKMVSGKSDGNSAVQLALEQINEKGYAEKYRDRGEPVHLVGVAFDADLRNLAAVKVISA